MPPLESEAEEPAEVLEGGRSLDQEFVGAFPGALHCHPEIPVAGKDDQRHARGCSLQMPDGGWSVAVGKAQIGENETEGLSDEAGQRRAEATDVLHIEFRGGLSEDMANQLGEARIVFQEEEGQALLVAARRRPSFHPPIVRPGPDAALSRP